MFYDVDRGGLRLRAVHAWQSLPVKHAFTDRDGGVSNGPYASLNLGLHVGDDAASVRVNRIRVAAALDCHLGQLVAGEQVHGNGVAVVTAADKGRGALRLEDNVAGVDALVTATPGIMLISFFADCVPILLFDPDTPAAGIVHAGWKGTALAAVSAAVEVMNEAFGTKPEGCLAAIGPSIGSCCYAVGADVAARLRATVPGNDADPIMTGPDNTLYADLQRANELLLIGAGLRGSNIRTDRLCTRCHHDRFFSYRASGGKTGRMAALIGLGPGVE